MQALQNKDDIIVSTNNITEVIELEKEGTLFRELNVKNKDTWTL